MSIGKMAKHRSLTSNTIINHILRMVDGGEYLDLDHVMPPPEKVAKIEATFLRTQGLQLSPVRELLGEDYSYEELALVRIRMTERNV